MSDDDPTTTASEQKAPGDCSETLQELELFLDGELPDDARSHVLAHIEACLECHQAYDFQAELKQIIAVKCGNDAMPSDLLSRIEQCITDADETPDTP